jgi:hypothetical protein
MDYLPGLTLNHNPPNRCLWSSKDYRREPLAPGIMNHFENLNYQRLLVLRTPFRLHHLEML